MLQSRRFSFPDDAVELYAERVAKRGLCAQTQVRVVVLDDPRYEPLVSNILVVKRVKDDGVLME